MARVVIEGLSKVFPGPRGEKIQAVRDVSLTIEAGEFMVLVGPSGCGKSSTLRMIAGLEEITAGTISLDGRVVNQVPPQDRDIAMVFQNHALYPHLTVFENLAFGLKLRKVPRPEIASRVAAAAEMLQLKDCLDRLPRALSGGQRQRAALGRAIVRQPKIFLFDEPLSNLDAQMRAELRGELARLHERLGATMIYVTHDQVEAMTMGDRIGVMRAGVIEQIGAPLEVYERPENLFVAGFIGTPPMNFLPGTIVRRGAELVFQARSAAGGVNFPLPRERFEKLAAGAGQTVVLGIRPENIHCRSDTDAGNSGVTMDATITGVEPTGPETFLRLANSDLSFIARVPPAFAAKTGAKIKVEFDLGRASFFDAATQNSLR